MIGLQFSLLAMILDLKFLSHRKLLSFFVAAPYFLSIHSIFFICL